MLTSGYELWKGLTDLPLALLAAVFGVLLYRKKSLAWSKFFFLAAIAGIGGITVHCLALPRRTVCALWIFLYVILYEVIRRMAFLLVEAIGKTKETSLFLPVSEGILYVITVIGLYTFPFNEIYVLVVFIGLVLIRVAVCAVRHLPLTKNVRLLLCLLPASALCQALSGILPYAVVWEHLLLGAALYAAYRIGAENGPAEPSRENR